MRGAMRQPVWGPLEPPGYLAPQVMPRDSSLFNNNPDDKKKKKEKRKRRELKGGESQSGCPLSNWQVKTGGLFVGECLM